MTLPAEIGQFFEESRIPLTLVDIRLPDHPVILANSEFYRLSGYSRDEVIGRNCRFMQHEGTSQATRVDIRNAIQGGCSTNVVIENITRAGQHFRNLLFLYPVNDAYGLPAYYLGSQFAIRPTETVHDFSDQLGKIDKGLIEVLADAATIHMQTQMLLSQTMARQLRAQLMATRLSA